MSQQRRVEVEVGVAEFRQIQQAAHSRLFAGFATVESGAASCFTQLVFHSGDSFIRLEAAELSTVHLSTSEGGYECGLYTSC
jgi:hypothetical protein